MHHHCFENSVFDTSTSPPFNSYTKHTTLFPCTASNMNDGLTQGFDAEYAPVIDPCSRKRERISEFAAEEEKASQCNAEGTHRKDVVSTFAS